MVYFFSGSLTQPMVDYLTAMPEYEPIDVLVSQLDRSAIKSMIAWQQSGVIGKLFIDSGAFSVHTGKAKVELEEYIEYLNSIDEYTDIVAQLDTIPGKFGQPKSAEDYAESSRKSWDNFLYMYKRLKSPEKLIPVFHYGESFDVLQYMLAWKDEEGNPLKYLGISPANDTSQDTKNIYMQSVYDMIKHSPNPNVKTHLFGMTSLTALERFPTYSADSISHRLIAGYNKIIHPKFGVISLSDKPRTSKTKSNMSFVKCADDLSLKELTDYIESLGLTLDLAMNESSARVAICMYTIMQKIKHINSVGVKEVKRTRKLFSI